LIHKGQILVDLKYLGSLPSGSNRKWRMKFGNERGDRWRFGNSHGAVGWMSSVGGQHREEREASEPIVLFPRCMQHSWGDSCVLCPTQPKGRLHQNDSGTLALLCVSCSFCPAAGLPAQQPPKFSSFILKPNTPFCK
jgi:hypothetical protein